MAFSLCFSLQPASISGSVGGLLGLYVGISFITMLEICIFFGKVLIYLCSCRCFHRRVNPSDRVPCVWRSSSKLFGAKTLWRQRPYSILYLQYSNTRHSSCSVLVVPSYDFSNNILIFFRILLTVDLYPFF